VNIQKEKSKCGKSLNEGIMFWHERFGHFSMASFKELDKIANGINFKKVPLHHVSKGQANLTFSLKIEQPKF